jgi:hypothetical protein
MKITVDPIAAAEIDRARIPQTISARQVRLWLVARGIQLSAVDAAIAAIPDATQREVAKVEWEWAPYLERAHPMIPHIASALGLTDADIDQAFREASAI